VKIEHGTPDICPSGELIHSQWRAAVAILLKDEPQYSHNWTSR